MRGTARPCRHEARHGTMTANESHSPDGENVTENSEQIEIDAVGGEAFVAPESAEVRLSDIEGVDGARLVSISIHNSGVNYRMLLSPEQSEQLGRELIDLASE